MMKKPNKKTVLIVSVLVILCLGIWTLWGNIALEVNEYEIVSDRIPEAFTGFRIAQVSDLHNKDFGEGYGQLLTLLSQINPDKQELEYYRSRNIRVMILDMPTTLCQVNEGQEWIIEMINAILIEVLASMAEQERIRTLNRQAEGILAAQLQGKHLGRPKMKIPEGWGEIYMLWKSGEITAVEAMKRSGLKKSTFYKLAKLTDENYPW